MASLNDLKFSPLAQKVFAEVAKIPRGSTTTYKAIAQTVGTSPRAVGNILHNNPDPNTYPCHRVIRSDGKLASGYAFGGKTAQLMLLLKEGVVVEAQ
jgi:O-6-methylguanine DNA methyltransferase